jgi:Malectin-like domain
MIARYPDDMYDRWWSNYSQGSWTEISTNSSVVPDASFETPSLVMQTAATTSSTEEALSINGNTRDTTYYAGPSFLLVLHFAEIKNSSMTDPREFSITLNGEQVVADYTPHLLASDSINFTNMGNPNTYVCSLEATSNSTLPPLLNAIELYLQFQYSYIPTHRQDGN